MNVRDVMRKDVITCSPDDTVGSLSKIFKESGISGVPVVEKGKVVGIVSETDLIKLFKVPEFSGELWLPSPLEVIEVPLRNLFRIEEFRKDLEEMKLKPVRDIMKKTVYSISPDDTLEEASRRMVRHRVNRLPVIENDKLVGIIARCDIIMGLSTIQE
ncbi:putative transcriptional regulator [Candidatus Methanoperedens nitroreducens]|uniref:Putative transcriptional regulator n=1 Tax=Candidatus Methanoperedens nitratireducens TaxID=1392998 RepID=A0A062V3J3_9EURY|nr:CBS domain-containing protein [Candidatus Methanoperedens nitroreducens]KCZ71198.1 putative transcriptional regulator [Candidatus Methanoperedens nitroreducens]MDJ1421422.1 CBS domain-containing protein [Candidatus Methanoperedens sp.]